MGRSDPSNIDAGDVAAMRDQLGGLAVGLTLVNFHFPEARGLVRTIMRASIGCEEDVARFRQLLVEMLKET